MTDSPRTPGLRFATFEEVASAIRAAGGRVSTARRLVLRALFEADGPVSAERLAAIIDQQGTGLELTSVYRNLERLEALGVVRHVHLGHGPGLYSLVGSGEREFLACERCDRVMSVEPDDLDAVRREIVRRFGFEARFSHFPITGLCPDCAGSAPETKEGAAMSHHHHDEESEHSHEGPHTHEHAHDGETHSHPHTSHEHEHVEHEHEHSHGDHVHSHPHVHEKGLEEAHDHEHDQE